MKNIKTIVDGDEPQLPLGSVRLLRSRDYSGLLLKDKIYMSDPGGEAHSHSNSIFCIVLQGGCTEIYGSTHRDYTQFNSEFLPPDQVHSLKFYSPVTRCLSIEIATTWMEKTTGDGLRVPDDALQFRGGLPMELFMKIHREFRIDDEASGVAIQGLTAEMLAHVSRLSLSTRQRPQWLEKVREILNAHFSDPLQMCDLANEVGVHPAHVSRQFRKYFGQTIGEYVRELRIRQT